MRISISTWGNVIAFGSKKYFEDKIKIVYLSVYGWFHDSWKQIGGNITTNDSIGRKISLSSDGFSVATVYRFNNTNEQMQNNLLVYKLTNSTWIQR